MNTHVKLLTRIILGMALFVASTALAQGGSSSSSSRLTTREFGFADVQPGYPLAEVGVPNSEIGFIERMIISLNEVANTLRIEALIKPKTGFPLPNALVVVLNEGGIPGEQGEYAYLLLDATDTANLRFSALAYSPNGPLGSINDGSVDPGAQPADVIFSGDVSSPEILNLEASEVDGKRRFVFEIRTATINSHTPLYPSATVNWKGIQSAGDAGIWLYTFTDFGVTYVDGAPQDAFYELIGGLDSDTTPFPYRPECMTEFVSQPASAGVPNEFFVGQAIEFAGGCLVSEGETAKISYGALPEGSVVSQEAGSTVKAGDAVFFAVPTTGAVNGDKYEFSFGCGSTAYDLPAVTCELDASVRDVACVAENNSELLVLLDGIGKDMHNINRRLARKARKAAPRKRKAIDARIFSSLEASNDSWQIWRFVPAETLQCEDGPRVLSLSLTEGRETYLEAIEQLRADGLALVRILRSAGEKRRARKLARKLRRQYQLAVEDSKNLPSETDVISK